VNNMNVASTVVDESSIPTFSASTNVKLGSDGTSQFEGLMDNIVIYEKNVSDEELKQIMNYRDPELYLKKALESYITFDKFRTNMDAEGVVIDTNVVSEGERVNDFSNKSVRISAPSPAPIVKTNSEINTESMSVGSWIKPVSVTERDMEIFGKDGVFSLGVKQGGEMTFELGNEDISTKQFVVHKDKRETVTTNSGSLSFPETAAARAEATLASGSYFASEFTMSMWFKLDSFATTRTLMSGIGFSTESSNKGLCVENGSLYLYDASNTLIVQVGNIVADQWYHLVLTDESLLLNYRKYEYTKSPIWTNDKVLKLGNNYSNNKNFLGHIDEFVLYTKRLDPLAIYDLFKGTYPSKFESLVVVKYEFDDSGTPGKDSGSAGINLTLTSATHSTAALPFESKIAYAPMRGPDGIIGTHYDFVDDVTDSSGNQNDALNEQNITFVNSFNNVSYRAAEFDGATSKINCPPQILSDMDDGFTATTWLQLPEVLTPNTRYPIFAQEGVMMAWLQTDASLTLSTKVYISPKIDFMIKEAVWNTDSVDVTMSIKSVSADRIYYAALMLKKLDLSVAEDVQALNNAFVQMGVAPQSNTTTEFTFSLTEATGIDGTNYSVSMIDNAYLYMRVVGDVYDLSSAKNVTLYQNVVPMFDSSVHNFVYTTTGPLHNFEALTLTNSAVSYLTDTVFSEEKYVAEYTGKSTHNVTFTPQNDFVLDVVFKQTRAGTEERHGVLELVTSAGKALLYVAHADYWRFNYVPTSGSGTVAATQLYTEGATTGMYPAFNEWGRHTYVFRKQTGQVEFYYNGVKGNVVAENTEATIVDGTTNVFTLATFNPFDVANTLKIGYANTGPQTDGTRIASVDVILDDQAFPEFATPAEVRSQSYTPTYTLDYSSGTVANSFPTKSGTVQVFDPEGYRLGVVEPPPLLELSTLGTSGVTNIVYSENNTRLTFTPGEFNMHMLDGPVLDTSILGTVYEFEYGIRTSADISDTNIPSVEQILIFSTQTQHSTTDVFTGPYGPNLLIHYTSSTMSRYDGNSGPNNHWNVVKEGVGDYWRLTVAENTNNTDTFNDLKWEIFSDADRTDLLYWGWMSYSHYGPSDAYAQTSGTYSYQTNSTWYVRLGGNTNGHNYFQNFSSGSGSDPDPVMVKQVAYNPVNQTQVVFWEAYPLENPVTDMYVVLLHPDLAITESFPTGVISDQNSGNASKVATDVGAVFDFTPVSGSTRGKMGSTILNNGDTLYGNFVGHRTGTGQIVFNIGKLFDGTTPNEGDFLRPNGETIIDMPLYQFIFYYEPSETRTVNSFSATIYRWYMGNDMIKELGVYDNGTLTPISLEQYVYTGADDTLETGTVTFDPVSIGPGKPLKIVMGQNNDSIRFSEMKLENTYAGIDSSAPVGDGSITRGDYELHQFVLSNPTNAAVQRYNTTVPLATNYGQFSEFGSALTNMDGTTAPVDGDTQYVAKALLFDSSFAPVTNELGYGPTDLNTYVHLIPVEDSGEIKYMTILNNNATDTTLTTFTQVVTDASGIPSSQHLAKYFNGMLYAEPNNSKLLSCDALNLLLAGGPENTRTDRSATFFMVIANVTAYGADRCLIGHGTGYYQQHRDRSIRYKLIDGKITYKYYRVSNDPSPIESTPIDYDATKSFVYSFTIQDNTATGEGYTLKMFHNNVECFSYVETDGYIFRYISESTPNDLILNVSLFNHTTHLYGVGAGALFYAGDVMGYSRVLSEEDHGKVLNILLGKYESTWLQVPSGMLVTGFTNEPEIHQLTPSEQVASGVIFSSGGTLQLDDIPDNIENLVIRSSGFYSIGDNHEVQHARGPAHYLFDGRYTRDGPSNWHHYDWHCAGQTDPWFVLDFGEERDVNILRLWRTGVLDGFKIKMSNDSSLTRTDVTSWDYDFLVDDFKAWRFVYNGESTPLSEKTAMKDYHSTVVESTSTMYSATSGYHELEITVPRGRYMLFMGDGYNAYGLIQMHILQETVPVKCDLVGKYTGTDAHTVSFTPPYDYLVDLTVNADSAQKVMDLKYGAETVSLVVTEPLASTPQESSDIEIIDLTNTAYITWTGSHGAPTHHSATRLTLTDDTELHLPMVPLTDFDTVFKIDFDRTSIPSGNNGANAYFHLFTGKLYMNSTMPTLMNFKYAILGDEYEHVETVNNYIRLRRKDQTTTYISSMSVQVRPSGTAVAEESLRTELNTALTATVAVTEVDIEIKFFADYAQTELIARTYEAWSSNGFYPSTDVLRFVFQGHERGGSIDMLNARFDKTSVVSQTLTSEILPIDVYFKQSEYLSYLNYAYPYAIFTEIRLYSGANYTGDYVPYTVSNIFDIEYGIGSGAENRGVSHIDLTEIANTLQDGIHVSPFCWFHPIPTDKYIQVMTIHPSEPYGSIKFVPGRKLYSQQIRLICGTESTDIVSFYHPDSPLFTATETQDGAFSTGDLTNNNPIPENSTFFQGAPEIALPTPSIIALNWTLSGSFGEVSLEPFVDTWQSIRFEGEADTVNFPHHNDASIPNQIHTGIFFKNQYNTGAYGESETKNDYTITPNDGHFRGAFEYLVFESPQIGDQFRFAVKLDTVQAMEGDYAPFSFENHWSYNTTPNPNYGYLPGSTTTAITDGTGLVSMGFYRRIKSTGQGNLSSEATWGASSTGYVHHEFTLIPHANGDTTKFSFSLRVHDGEGTDLANFDDISVYESTSAYPFGSINSSQGFTIGEPLIFRDCMYFTNDNRRVVGVATKTSLANPSVTSIALSTMNRFTLVARAATDSMEVYHDGLPAVVTKVSGTTTVTDNSFTLGSDPTAQEVTLVIGGDSNGELLVESCDVVQSTQIITSFADPTYVAEKQWALTYTQPIALDNVTPADTVLGWGKFDYYLKSEGTKLQTGIEVEMWKDYFQVPVENVWGTDKWMIIKTIDGKYYGVGFNQYGQMGMPYTEMTSMTDATNVAESYYFKVPVELPHFAAYDIKKMILRRNSTMFLTTDGKLYGMGKGEATHYCHFGTGTNSTQLNTITHLATDKVIKDFHQSGATCIILTTDNKLFTVGNNNEHGALGNSNTTSTNTFGEVATNITSIETIKQVYTTDGHSASGFFTESGRAFACGWGYQNQYHNGQTHPATNTSFVELKFPDGRKIKQFFMTPIRTWMVDENNDIYVGGAHYETSGWPSGVFGASVKTNGPTLIDSSINDGTEVLDILHQSTTGIVVVRAGGVYAFGKNDEGRLGNGDAVTTTTTTRAYKIADQHPVIAFITTGLGPYMLIGYRTMASIAPTLTDMDKVTDVNTIGMDHGAGQVSDPTPFVAMDSFSALDNLINITGAVYSEHTNIEKIYLVTFDVSSPIEENITNEALIALIESADVPANAKYIGGPVDRYVPTSVNVDFTHTYSDTGTSTPIVLDMMVYAYMLAVDTEGRVGRQFRLTGRKNRLVLGNTQEEILREITFVNEYGQVSTWEEKSSRFTITSHITMKIGEDGIYFHNHPIFMQGNWTVIYWAYTGPDAEASGMVTQHPTAPAEVSWPLGQSINEPYKYNTVELSKYDSQTGNNQSWETFGVYSGDGTYQSDGWSGSYSISPVRYTSWIQVGLVHDAVAKTMTAYHIRSPGNYTTYALSNVTFTTSEGYLRLWRKYIKNGTFQVDGVRILNNEVLTPEQISQDTRTTSQFSTVV